MNKETFETIIELRNNKMKWADIFAKYNLKYKSIHQMVMEFTREKYRRKKYE